MPPCAGQGRPGAAALALHRVRDLLQRSRTMLGQRLASPPAESGVLAPPPAAPRGAARGRRSATSARAGCPSRRARSCSCWSSSSRRWRSGSAALGRAAAGPAPRRPGEPGGWRPFPASGRSPPVPCVGDRRADPTAFRSGREFAAWLGPVPRQNSSGGKARLGRISKRGRRSAVLTAPGPAAPKAVDANPAKRLAAGPPARPAGLQLARTWASRAPDRGQERIGRPTARPVVHRAPARNFSRPPPRNPGRRTRATAHHRSDTHHHRENRPDEPFRRTLRLT